ncbi:sensor histidine kinase [Alginatibacterium sediminis]|uniref:histidine kinase n=2 Tax=Alginatibacterium sediminis TaxID=2164068 RepID=A0A420EDR5_9ALTE|nr:sensor histidine kinase [Alginatibacterium sediminis]
MTASFCALMLIIVSILIGVLYDRSVGQMQRSQEQQFSQLIEQQQALADQLDPDAFLEQFIPQAQENRQFLMVARINGQIYGRLQSWPKGIRQCPSRNLFPIWSQRYEELQLVSGCQIGLSQGQELLIATDDTSLRQLKDQFISSAAIALLISFSFALIAGWWFSAQVLRRIQSINAVAQQVSHGKMSLRVPPSSNNDEFDLLGSNINQMLDRLQNSLEMIVNNSDAIAHDLRTPLARLRLRLEQAYIQAENQQLSSDELGIMIEELDEILSTFSSILELSKLESGTLGQAKESISLNQIIEDACDLAQPLAEEQQQNLHLMTNEQVMVNADRRLLFRAVYNLVENAIKYAGANARIDVVINAQDFRIIDNGPGIPKSEHNKVFRRLYRMESSRSSPGHGLGLALVKAILDNHQMQIELISAEPGLEVRVSL